MTVQKLAAQGLHIGRFGQGRTPFEVIHVAEATIFLRRHDDMQSCKEDHGSSDEDGLQAVEYAQWG